MLRFVAVLSLIGCGGAAAPAPKPTPAPVAPAPAPAPAPPAAPAAPPTAPAGAKVMFVSPKEGDKVKSPVHVVMGLEGMEVKPAGDATPNSGHHHLIVDGAAVPPGTTVPKDEQHIHFGKGQTEADVELKPGPHTLTLQFADGNHASYGEALSTTIHITVE